MDIDQKDRFSKAEMELMRKTFIDNTLLYAIRNVFFQFSNEPVDLPENVLKLVEKVFLPDLNPDVPILAQNDPYFLLSTIKELNPGVANLHIMAKDLQVAYLKQQFDVLAGKKPKISIKLLELKQAQGKDEEARFVEMMAYLLLTNASIDSCINFLQVKANTKEETPEEMVKKQKQNSSK